MRSLDARPDFIIPCWQKTSKGCMGIMVITLGMLAPKDMEGRYHRFQINSY